MLGKLVKELDKELFDKYIYLFDSTNKDILRYVNKYSTLLFHDKVCIKYIDLDLNSNSLLENEIDTGFMFYNLFPDNVIQPIGYRYYKNYLCYITYKVEGKNLKNYTNSCTNIDDFSVVIRNLVDLINKIYNSELNVIKLDLDLLYIVINTDLNISLINFEKTIMGPSTSSGVKIDKFDKDMVLKNIFIDLKKAYTGSNLDILNKLELLTN